MFLAFNMPAVGAPTQPGMLAEAKAAFQRAEALDRDDFMVGAAGYMLGSRERRPLSELEAGLKPFLQRAPQRWEFPGYQTVSLFYAGFLQRTGRIRDSLPLYRTAAELRPFGTGALYGYGQTLALLGNGEAYSHFERTFAGLPSSFGWENWIGAAVFLGIGDAEALLAAPPASISEPVLKCWRDLNAAIRSQQQSARAAGAAKAKECLAAGVLTTPPALWALSALGDLDDAFAVAGDPRALSGAPAALFAPPTRAMRADPRFLPLVEKLGLMEYWKASGTRPDVCETEAAPFCAALAESKP
jgi:hypothetical protein